MESSVGAAEAEVRREAREMARREVAVRFPVLHEGNAEEARAFEERRYQDLARSLRMAGGRTS